MSIHDGPYNDWRSLVIPTREHASLSTVMTTDALDRVFKNQHTPLRDEPGVKDDAEKLRFDLIAPEALTALTTILTYGCNKYGDRNWERGMSWGRPFAALMRHMWAWWARSGPDPETGYSHLWHAIACISFLITYEARKMDQYDDRPNVA